MSFTEKKFVAIHCDECDEQYDPEDGSAYYTDKDDADDDASSDGWQLDGDENHYCPQHWHLTCSKCGKTAMGNHDELIEKRMGLRHRRVAVPGMSLRRKFEQILRTIKNNRQRG